MAVAVVTLRGGDGLSAFGATVTGGIEQLRPDRANANKGTVRGRALLEDSLRRYGAGRSILADKHGNVIAGNKTLESAADIGLPVRFVESDGTDLIVVRRTDLDLDTDSAARELAYADNRIAALDLDWDIEQLLADRDAGIDLAAVGFDADELAALLAGIGDDPTEGLTDPDAVPPVPEKPVTKPGDVWQLGKHRVMCGDSTAVADVEHLIDGAKIDVLLTDPPYCSGGFQEAGKKSGSIGTRGDEMIANDTLSTRGYIALMKNVLSLARVGVIYVFTDWRMWVNLFDVAESSGFGVRNMVVWDKGTPGMGRGWRSQHELILCAMKVTQPFDPHKAQGNVIQSSRTGNILHPTEKPVDLIVKVLDVTDMAKTVYDPFGGSGTTLIGCEQMGGRTAFVMELDPRFCDVIVTRWEQFTGLKARRA